MAVQIAIAASMIGILFVMFLVISKATGGIDNTLYKLEYLLRKECDIRLESLEFKYRMKAADEKFEETYGKNVKHLADDIRNATDSNE